MTMGNLAPIMPNDDNVISVTLIDGKLSKKSKVRYNKDGTIDKRHSNKLSGVSSEVYPFISEEEIESVVNLLNKRIEEAVNENQKQIACRNKMMFLVGVNLGIRASDLVDLRYSYFIKEDGTFKNKYKFQPKKTKKTKKFVELHFNQTVKKAIAEYVEKYPVENLDEYLFKSRKGNTHITEWTLWDFVSKIAIEVGIERNMGSHSLRKTWGYTIWHNAKDKNKALVMLQQCFGHTNSLTTMKYIGILDEEKKDMYESVEIGLDYI